MVFLKKDETSVKWLKWQNESTITKFRKKYVSIVDRIEGAVSPQLLDIGMDKQSLPKQALLKY